MRKSVALILGLFVLGTSTLACANDSVFTTKNDNGTFMGRGSAMLRNNSNTKSTMASGVMSGGMTQATGTAVPVGTVITWPAGSNPEGWDNGEWIECNGGAIPNTPEYALLRAKLGTGTVPNYNGMFLRGYGSTTAHASDGTSITYKSDNLGTIQHDGVYVPEGSANVSMTGEYISVTGGTGNPTAGSNIGTNTYKVLAAAKGKYRTVTTVTVDRSQGDHFSYNYNTTYKFEGWEDYDNYTDPTGIKITNADPNLKETRPINTAVRYLIRAK